jgi:hypothetical protein
MAEPFPDVKVKSLCEKVSGTLHLVYPVVSAGWKVPDTNGTYLPRAPRKAADNVAK